MICKLQKKWYQTLFARGIFFTFIRGWTTKGAKDRFS